MKTIETMVFFFISLVSETRLFLKQGFLFSSLLSIYLVDENFFSSLSAQCHCHNHNHNHCHYHHFKAKKRIGYSWYSIPEFLVISFADSVAVFDSLSDCSFLCQYWYSCYALDVHVSVFDVVD